MNGATMCLYLRIYLIRLKILIKGEEVIKNGKTSKIVGFYAAQNFQNLLWVVVVTVGYFRFSKDSLAK